MNDVRYLWFGLDGGHFWRRIRRRNPVEADMDVDMMEDKKRKRYSEENGQDSIPRVKE